MFAKFRVTSSSSSSSILSSNPISQQFDVGPQICTAGPDLVWKVFQAKRKSDGKEASIFVFEKRVNDRLHRPKRKDSITEIMKASIKRLEVYRQPKLILQVVHGLEECADTVAFASEPILSSLANILTFSAWRDTTDPRNEMDFDVLAMSRPAGAVAYAFIDFEIKYGIRQIAEAVDFLSPKLFHHNICPSSIMVTKFGNWKLAGMEFMLTAEGNSDRVPCASWTTKASKLTQPDLDFIAPEVQLSGYCGTYSDVFSLGLVICAIFNKGKSIIQAADRPSNYLKQLDGMDDILQDLVPSMPLQLQEMVVKMMSREKNDRPSFKTLLNTPYFCDGNVETLQTLDVIHLKEPVAKSHFYRNSLKTALRYLPEKIRYQRVWPFLQAEMQTPDSLASALQPVMLLIQESSPEDYEKIILPEFRKLLQSHRSIQATVTILENLHIILEKTPKDDVRREVLPVLYKAFESNSIQIQSAALIAVTNVSSYLDESAIRRMVIPKIKNVYDSNTNDPKVLMHILNCIEKILDRLDKTQVIDDVLPIIWDFRVYDCEMIIKILRIYRIMLNDKNRYGLSFHLIATHVVPTLVPLTVNALLNLETFTVLLEMLTEMLDVIDRNQRNKLKLDCMSLPSPERHRPLRHLKSTDNMHVQPFNIPNLRVEQRKTSSAEDMARKNSTGSTWGNWLTSSPVSESNFLRVINNSFPNRRLSDNTLMAPKIRIAPSCASSPGGTPGGSTGGLPIRRHSSIGPQERRGSTINLSPPTGLRQYKTGSRDGSTLSVPSACLARSMIGGSMPNTSSSSPFLWSGSNTGSGTIRTGHRPSACMLTSPAGSSSLLHQLSSGMQNFFGNK